MKTVDKLWGTQHIAVDENGNEAVVANVIKDRRLFIDDPDMSLEPNTMIGSHFLTFVNGDCVWKGAVVAEPMAGRFLCHIDTLAAGEPPTQRIFSLDVLMGSGPRRYIENAYGQTASINVENMQGQMETVIERATTDIVVPEVEWRFYDSEEACMDAFRALVAAKAQKEQPA